MSFLSFANATVFYLPKWFPLFDASSSCFHPSTFPVFVATIELMKGLCNTVRPTKISFQNPFHKTKALNHTEIYQEIITNIVWLISSFLVTCSVLLCLNKTPYRADCIKNTLKQVCTCYLEKVRATFNRLYQVLTVIALVARIIVLRAV